ncbi:putative paf acetylhydrolase family protein [Diaporthe ampelina]|uniref:1-alkyl-2-acetylglycerophosphocholine esterase n=1 Tax=Diaporthe ampelina TaxID=1214573 RepID=A0A0G2HNG8_9PEZI|nr:putative paf acetylhydrolase family protein [Diaporthe ampelina]
MAPLFDAHAGVPNGTSASLISRSYLNAPLVNSELPILLFGHGFGGTRLIYTSQLEELASHGWIIVNVDHTYDAIAVEFPDGRVVPMNLPPDAGLEFVELSLETRAADYKFVVDSLSDPATLKRIPGLEGGDTKLRTDAVGASGHSLGGAASAQAMANYSTFACGANFDGSMFGPVVQSGLGKPFVQVAAQNHTRDNDPSWAEFWENVDGFKRDFNLNGTVHVTFEDVTIYRDLLGENFPMDEGGLYGTLPGGRLLQIETEFMDAFFGYCLKGQDAGGLDQLLEDFPEVSVMP